MGSTTFHNVSFAVLPDVEPWRSMPPGHGGIIGIPILLHLGCIRWIKGGRWEIACRDDSSRSDTANMVFFGNHLLLASTIANRQSFMTLDTGAETTDLNANFARAEFARNSRRWHEKQKRALKVRAECQSSTLSLSRSSIFLSAEVRDASRGECHDAGKIRPLEVVAVLATSD
jgi:hypothetical protein